MITSTLYLKSRYKGVQAYSKMGINKEFFAVVGEEGGVVGGISGNELIRQLEELGYTVIDTKFLRDLEDTLK